MGLYSTNKVATVGAVVNEHNEIVREIEECVVNKSFGDIMEAVIQLHENDQKMFDALIECDFMSAVNESVMLEADAEEANAAADEKKKSKIMEMIHKVIDSVVEWIKKAAANIIYKITDICKTDEKLYNAYKPVLNMKNIEGFKGIADFAYPKNAVKANDLQSVDSAKAAANIFNNEVANVENKEEMDAKFNQFKEKMEAVKQNCENLTTSGNYFEEPVEMWIPANDGVLSSMLDNMKSGKDTIDAIKNRSAEVIGALKELKATAKSDKKAAGKEASEMEVYRLNLKYKVASETCSTMSKYFKAYTAVAMKQVAAYRKASILCGRYALKAVKGAEPAKEEGVGESLIMWAIGESSDLYVEERFGY